MKILVLMDTPIDYKIDVTRRKHWEVKVREDKEESFTK